MEVNRSAIARATNTNLAHISRIFSGKRKPSLTLARKISAFLGVTVEELCQELKINGVELKELRRRHDDVSGSATESHGAGREIPQVGGLEVSGESDAGAPSG